MKQFDARVIENREVAQEYFEIFFSWPEDLRSPLPGQILTINVEKGFAPFLRRPFAFASFDKEKKIGSMIYHRRGPATQILSARRAGESIDIIAPRGFPFQLKKGKSPILLGGGVGIGPMIFAANWLTQKGLRPLLVMGFRHQDLVPQIQVTSGVSLQICTEDGSAGFHGNVLDFLRSTDQPAEDAFLWACGPEPMLKATAEWARQRGLPCQVSMEQSMACGVGACLGCTIETTDERKMVRLCTEGPVFDAEVIKWT